jgi:hypothetical protein
MSMFDRITMQASDHDRTRRFLDVVLAPLGCELSDSGEGFSRWDEFVLTQAGGDAPSRAVCTSRSWPPPAPTSMRSGKRARTPAMRANGEPGLRPQYASDNYGAFLLDPEGSRPFDNSTEWTAKKL